MDRPVIGAWLICRCWCAQVLLYLTPLHCQDMLASLVGAMNAQYAKFRLRHPDFQVCVC